MGFSGSFIVHRGHPLLEDLLPDVDEFHQAELCYDGVNGDWQVTRVFAGFDDLPEDLLPRLGNATAAPVLAAEVIDSDAALVHAIGNSVEWKTWLQLDRMIPHIEPHPAPFDEHDNYLGGDWIDPGYAARADAQKQRILAEIPGDRVAAEAAVAWARGAGLRPSTIEEITDTMQRNDTFAEDVLFTLLNQLGLATDDVQMPAPPAPVDVLRERMGHRLTHADLMAHEPVRGERLVHHDMADLRLTFAGLPAVTACACHGEMFFRPDQPIDAPVTAVAVAVPASPMTDAVTIRGSFAGIKGVVLRFDEEDVYFAAHNGVWLAANGADDFRDQLGDSPKAVLNSWLSQLY